MRWKVNVFSGTILCFLVAQSRATQQQPAATVGADWPMYRHDHAGTGYSPLSQIDTRNVSNLSLAWTFGLQSDVQMGSAVSYLGKSVNVDGQSMQLANGAAKRSGRPWRRSRTTRSSCTPASGSPTAGASP